MISLTKKFTLRRRVAADLYRCCWQAELFFKWIKQHFRIKSLFGPSENSIRTLSGWPYQYAQRG
ncbi:MAG: transposase [Desulfobulbaceae bacterium]|nr:transposase [Desulfobulbaceae bacterium]